MAEPVTMRWPDGLRARVKEAAGAQGMTGWVLDAVVEKLAGPEHEGDGQVQAAREEQVADPIPWPEAAPGKQGCAGFRPQAGNPLRCECGLPARGH